MKPGRQQDAAPTEDQRSHPVKRIAGIVFALVLMPLLVVIGWNKAVQFDPYAMSFFTKTYVEPTPDMPEQIRIAGWVNKSRAETVSRPNHDRVGGRRGVVLIVEIVPR